MREWFPNPVLYFAPRLTRYILAIFPPKFKIMNSIFEEIIVNVSNNCQRKGLNSECFDRPHTRIKQVSTKVRLVLWAHFIIYIC